MSKHDWDVDSVTSEALRELANSFPDTGEAMEALFAAAEHVEYLEDRKRRLWKRLGDVSARVERLEAALNRIANHGPEAMFGQPDWRQDVAQEALDG